MTLDPLPRQDARPPEGAAVVSFSIAVGAAALLVLGVQPILLGGLAEAGRLSTVGVGHAATAELFAFAVGASLGAFTLNGHLRFKTCLIALALAATDLLIYLPAPPVGIVFERGLAGLLEGALLAAPNLILTHHRRPERMNGFLIGFGTAPQIAAAYLFPVLVIPHLGLNAGFAVLALGAVFAAIACWSLVDRVEIQQEAVLGRLAWTPALVFMLAAIFLQNVAAGATWSYLERLGHQHGLAGGLIGGAIAGSLALQVIGALAAAGVSQRFKARAILVTSAILQAALTVGLAQAAAPAAFVALCCTFGLFLLAQQPYQVREVIRLDPSRKAALLIPAVVMIGQSLGPAAAAYVITANDVRGGMYLSAAALLVAAVLLLAPSRRPGLVGSPPGLTRESSAH